MSVADEIRQRLDIVDLVSEYVTLKKAGRSYKGLCPFHQEKTPSFHVFPETQSWHCFGACGEGGDVFSFIQKREGVDFGEALRILAPKAGVSLHAPTAAAAKEAAQRDRLSTVLEAAAAFFIEQLASEPGQVARDYLSRRGVAPETAEAFGLGYSPGGWRGLSTRLMARGYSRRELADAGLISERDEGHFFDRFRHRLMFPIWDGRGNILGFGARSLDGSDPKYLNSPQTALFDKGSLLYGLHLARQAIMAAETAVIVEGYMDVIAAHEAGYRNVVASMGTAISPAQLQSLGRIAKRYVLALDADAAGNAATMRGLAVASEALREDGAPTFDGGLLHFEHRLNAEIRVAVLPTGLDPDDLIRRDAPTWERLIAEAKSIVDYQFEVALAEEDLTDAKGKARFARRLMPVLAAIGDAVERAHYAQQMARHLQIDVRVVEQELAAARTGDGPGRTGAKRPPVVLPSSSGESFGLEEYALRFLLHDPQSLSETNKMLNDAGLEPLASADFDQAPNKSLFAELTDHGIGDRLAFRASLDADMRRLYDWIDGSWATSPEADEKSLWQDGVTSVMRLRVRRLKGELRRLQLALESADTPAESVEYYRAVERTRRQLDFVMEILARRSSLRVLGS